MLYHDMSMIDEKRSPFKLDDFFSESMGSYNHWKKAFKHLNRDKKVKRGGGGKIVETILDQLTPPAETHTAILSDEALGADDKGNPVCDKNTLLRFKSRLSQLFDDFEIVVYLRKQADYATSLVLQRIKNGHQGIADMLLERARNPEADDPMLNYQVLLTMWAEVFGRDKMKVRLFDRKHFIDGDLVVDFATTCDLPWQKMTCVQSVNESIDNDAVTFLNSLQRKRQYKTTNLMANGRVWLMDILSRKYKGKSPVLTRAQAERIVETYRASNRAVAREYFGSEELFNEDCSMYPEEMAPHKLTVEKSVEMAAHLCDESFKLYDSFQQTIREQKTSLDTNEMTIKSLEKKLADYQAAMKKTERMQKKTIDLQEEAFHKQEAALKKQTKAIKRHQAEIKRLKTRVEEMRLKNRLRRLLGRFHLSDIARRMRNGLPFFRRPSAPVNAEAYPSASNHQQKRAFPPFTIDLSEKTSDSGPIEQKTERREESETSRKAA